MKKLFAIAPAILATAFLAPVAEAVPATTIKQIGAASEQRVELTNAGKHALKIVARTGYDRQLWEFNPHDNNIVELFVAPGKSVEVNGPYAVYEYVETTPFVDPFQYTGN
ncbi:MAG: hypothetical protein L6Q60_01380 [Rhodocyclaceae bacterium]|nr:hypothetical protein [Rhodocyclaceae bacterium]